VLLLGHPIYRVRVSLEAPKYCLCIQSNNADLQLYIQGESLARGPKILSMYTVEQRGFATMYIQGESLARGPKLLSMYTVEQRGFLVRKYWQTGSFKACQTAFRTEFGERRAPSNCCIQKLVKKLETRGSRSNACPLLWGA